mmetsp:Transcript_19929/g.28033  ORF Transcript_19929/g.28033 Transcript_19929/m.28033 type:complete len:177 (-) Transcript_19929:1487-2017(-)
MVATRPGQRTNANDRDSFSSRTIQSLEAINATTTNNSSSGLTGVTDNIKHVTNAINHGQTIHAPHDSSDMVMPVNTTIVNNSSSDITGTIKHATKTPKVMSVLHSELGDNPTSGIAILQELEDSLDVVEKPQTLQETHQDVMNIKQSSNEAIIDYTSRLKKMVKILKCTKYEVSHC